MNKYPKYGFFWLLASLLLIFLINPVLAETLNLWFDLIFTFLILSTVYLLSKERKMLAIGALLAFPILILKWHYYFSLNPASNIIALVLLLLLFFLICYQMIVHLTHAKTINADLIFAAICIYLFIGLIFSTAYTLHELLDPGSYQGINAFSYYTHPDRLFELMIYFSFVTLTTLGYGDITPMTPIATHIAILEAILGQFYIATIVAALIGLLLRKSPQAYEQI